MNELSECERRNFNNVKKTDNQVNCNKTASKLDISPNVWSAVPVMQRIRFILLFSTNF